VVASSQNQTLAGNSESPRTVDCPAGKKVVGGGALVFGSTGRWIMESSGPTSDTQWAVLFTNLSADPVKAVRVDVIAICVNAAP
jgi:hypothetical protein